MPFTCNSLCFRWCVLSYAAALLAYQAKAQADFTLGSQIPESSVQGLSGAYMPAASGSISQIEPATQDPLLAMPYKNSDAQAFLPSNAGAQLLQPSNTEAQASGVRLNAPQTPPLLGSDPGPSLMVATVPEGTLEPVLGARKLFPDVAPVDISELDRLPLPELGPDPLACVPLDQLNGSLAKPAVCPGNPAFQSFAEGTAVQSTCQVNLYASKDRRSFVSCSGAFVSPAHFALAGHCVANGGTGRYSVVNVNGRLGTVCCRTNRNTNPDNCATGYGFDVIGVAAPSGWLNRGDYSNDGAVLKVRKPANVAGGAGTPLRYGAPEPFCFNGPVRYAGYPAQSISFTGCNQAFNNRLHFTDTSGIARCSTSAGTASLIYQGSSCPGNSGGPLYVTDNRVIGIVSQSSTRCSSGVSYTYFAAVTNGGISWGVPVGALITQLG